MCPMAQQVPNNGDLSTSQFNAIMAKLSKLDVIENKLDHLTTKVAALETRVTKVETITSEVKKSVTFSSQKVDEFTVT